MYAKINYSPYYYLNSRHLFAVNVFNANIQNICEVFSMVGDLTGFGGWGNTIEVRNMKDLPDVDKRNHTQKLFNEETKEFLEWKSWCIRYNRLPNCFGNKENNSHESFVSDDGKRIVSYLKKQGGSFDIVSKAQASHILEQIFDSDNQLLNQEIRKI